MKFSPPEQIETRYTRGRSTTAVVATIISSMGNVFFQALVTYRQITYVAEAFQMNTCLFFVCSNAGD